MTIMLRNLVQKGYKLQILWIQRALRRVLDSRSSQVSVPIVPLTEENETAMEDEMFLSFLKHIGISPPTNEQEAFWRIPAELEGDRLKQLVDGLTIDDNGEPVNGHLIEIQKVSTRDKKGKKKGKKEKKKKDKTRKSKDQKKKIDNKETNETTKEEKQKKTKKKMDMLQALADKRKTKQDIRRKSKVSSDASSDEEVSMETEVQPPVITTPKSIVTTPKTDFARKSSSSSKKRRVKRLIDSDNSDTDVVTRVNIDNKESDVEEESQSQKRPLVFGDSSDEESQPAKRQKLSDSEDSDVPLSAVANKRQNLSDSEDSDMPLSAVTNNQSESFPATLYSQGPLDSDDSVEDDHVPLRSVLQRKNRIESDDED